MDRETVIALAREAGIDDWWDSGDEQRGVLQTHLEQFAALIEAHLKDQGYRQCAKGQRTTQFCGMLEQAVKAEREACARVCDELVGKAWVEDCAAAIRSRT